MQKAEREYEKRDAESFAGLPIPGLLKDEWRQFIRAGEEYLHTLEVADTYPAAGNECLYCRQPLPPEAVAFSEKIPRFLQQRLAHWTRWCCAGALNRYAVRFSKA